MSIETLVRPVVEAGTTEFSSAATVPEPDAELASALGYVMSYSAFLPHTETELILNVMGINNSHSGQDYPAPITVNGNGPDPESYYV